MSGPTWVDFNIRNGRRQSAATAFLRPVLEQGNVTVLVDAPVLRLDLSGRRCVGVMYLHNGSPVSVTADSEVIVSAGALDSPKLLMLSGIGKAENLIAVGIDVVVDLPVGDGLQDHLLCAGVNYEAIDPLPVSHYNHAETYMWERTDSRLIAPDYVLVQVSLSMVSDAHRLDYEHGYCILSGVARPHSRGFVKLASANPDDAMIIEPNFLAEQQDWVAYRYGAELAREIGAQKDYAPYRKRETLPDKDGVLTETEWRSFLSTSLNTFYHPASTCRMGQGAEAVVDPELRVHGVEGLRVADAAIMPSITTGNANAPSMMIGWKCGTMIAETASA